MIISQKLVLANRVNSDRSLNTSALKGTNPENEAQPKVHECIAPWTIM